jgi:hypothetical protein
MISSFAIENFRCFERLELPHLSRVNLIVGKNGAGKSALLEGIWLGRNFSPYSMFDLLRLRSELPDEGTAGHVVYKEIASILNVTKQKLRCIVDNKALEISISFGHKEQLLMFVRGSEKFLYTKNDISDLLSVKEIFFDPSGGDCMLPSYGFSKAQLADFWDSITLTDLEDAADEAVRLIRADAQRIAFIGDKDRRRIPVVKIPGKGAVPMARLGDGIVRIFGVALAITNSRGNLVLIDEIENGIHYSAMPNLWRLVFQLCNKLDVQAFIATHSWDCISAFAEVAKEVDADAQLIRLERDDSGTRVVTYDKDMLATAAAQGIEVR